MGTYLYFGKLTKEKKDAKMVVSNKNDYRPCDNGDGFDYFFQNIPSKLLPKEYEYTCREEKFYNVVKGRQAYDLLIENKILDENESEMCRIVCAKEFVYVDYRCITKTSSYNLETDFFKEPFILTEELIDKYIKDFNKNIDDEEDLQYILSTLMIIRGKISCGEIWFNLCSEDRRP